MDVCIYVWATLKSNWNKINKKVNSLGTGSKVNAHKTFGRLLNVLYTFNLYPDSRGLLRENCFDFDSNKLDVDTCNLVISLQ